MIQTHSPINSCTYYCNSLFYSELNWALFSSVATERSGPGVPRQISTTTCGNPRVCSGQQQGQAKWWRPARKACLFFNIGETQPQGVAVGGWHGGGLVGTGVWHPPLGGATSWALPYTGDTGRWILFKDKTDSSLVLALTSGRIKLNSEPRLVSTGPLHGEPVLSGNWSGMFVVSLCVCVLVRSSYVVSLGTVIRCVIAPNYLLKSIYLNICTEKELFYSILFDFLMSQCQQLWSSVEVCIAKLMCSLCRLSGEAFTRKKKGIVRF